MGSGNFGVCQWSFDGSPESPSGGRWKDVYDYLMERGFPYDHLGGQVQGIFESDDNSGDYAIAIEEMRNIEDAEEAAAHWVDTWEISGEHPGDPGYDNRLKYARQAIEIYNGERDDFD